MAQPVTVRPSPPSPATAPAPVAPAPPPPRTWRGVALRARERFFVGLAAAATGVATLWVVLSTGYSVMLRSATSLPSESTLHLFTWQYDVSQSALFSSAEWMTPPLLVVGLLIAASILLDTVTQGMAQPIRKAKGKLVTVRWAEAGARTRAKAELRAAGYAGLGGNGAKVRLVLGTVLAAAAGALGFLVPLQDGYTRGVGPLIVGGAVLVAVVAALAATPWSHWPQVTLFGDGSLTVDGHEPLADVVPLAARPVAPSAPAAPPPPSYAKAAGDPYPPPPPGASSSDEVARPAPHRWEAF